MRTPSEDDVPEEVKEQRAQEIMELQGGISMELNEAKVGKVFRVLVDKAESGHYIARTEFDSPEVDSRPHESYLPQGHVV